MPSPFTEDDWTSDLFKAGAWDIWVSARGPDSKDLKLLDTLEELLAHLEVEGLSARAQRQAITAFMARPVALSMPDRLRREVIAFLGNE